MGIDIPLSAETMKMRKDILSKDAGRLWRYYFNDLPMIPRYKTMTKYVVGTDVIVKRNGNHIWVNDVQDFYSGEEIELMKHIEYIAAEFSTIHIVISIKNMSGFIEHTATIGGLLC